MNPAVLAIFNSKQVCIKESFFQNTPPRDSFSSTYSRLLTFQDLQNSVRIDTEACRGLTRRILFERLHELDGENLTLGVQINVLRHPVAVLIRRYIRSLIGIHAEIKHLRQTQT